MLATTFTEHVEVQIDFEVVLNNVPAELRVIAEQLKTKTPSQLARDLGITRSTLYSRIAELRTLFQDAGFGNEIS